MSQNTLPPFRPLLLGSGKVAKHFHHYFHEKQVPHSHWDDARNLDEVFFEKLSRSSSVWLLVSDQAIEELYLKIKSRRPDLHFVHASGSMNVSGVASLHPLMTFGPELYSIQDYEKIPFTVIEEEWNDQHPELIGFFNHFKNPRHSIRSKDRSLYHAYCVMISNFPQILWSETFLEIKKTAVGSPELYEPLLRQSVTNFLKMGESALTGPLVRQDQKTIEKHLQSLAASPLASLYQAFVQFYQKLNKTEKNK